MERLERLDHHRLCAMALKTDAIDGESLLAAAGTLVRRNGELEEQVAHLQRELGNVRAELAREKAMADSFRSESATDASARALVPPLLGKGRRRDRAWWVAPPLTPTGFVRALRRQQLFHELPRPPLWTSKTRRVVPVPVAAPQPSPVADDAGEDNQPKPVPVAALQPLPVADDAGEDNQPMSVQTGKDCAHGESLHNAPK